MSEGQQHSECAICSAFGLLVAALIGGAIGAGVALVLAPKAGPETVADLRARAGSASEVAQSKARELVAAAKQKIEEARAHMETMAPAPTCCAPEATESAPEA